MLHSTMVELMENKYLVEALVGFESTGHCWPNLGQFLISNNIKFIMVNLHRVHKAREMDDNSPSKSDCKDLHIIANLVNDRR